MHVSARVAAAALALTWLGAAQAQDRSADLVQALQLRPDQEAAFAAYLKATASDQASDARRSAEGARLAQMTTPQRFDWTRAQVAADLAEMDAEGPAVKGFYAQLTPVQQRIFDAKTAPAAPDR